MFWFGLGGLLVYVSTLVVSLVLKQDEMREMSVTGIATMLLGVVMLPVLVQTLIAELTAKILCKRLFDVRPRSRFKLFALGGIVTLLSIVVTAFTLPFVGELRYEIASLAIPAGLFAFLIVAFTARVRPGRCLHCNYSLSVGVARCPECGEFVQSVLPARQECLVASALEQKPTP